MAEAKVWSTSCGARAPRMQAPRIVTLLFTDVEGSTRLLGALGDAFVAVIERHRVILGEAAIVHRGSGYPRGGDGCIFVFGSAGDAVAAAVAAQRALAAEPWPGGACVRVQIAVHAGEVTEVGDELCGMALHQASARRAAGVVLWGPCYDAEWAKANRYAPPSDPSPKRSPSRPSSDETTRRH